MLNIIKEYYFDICRPIIKKEIPYILDCLAVGLVGEGSECFGYNDELSEDHDFGLRLYFWLNEKDEKSYGEELRNTIELFPKEYKGYKTINTRTGVYKIDDFYTNILNSDLPKNDIQWDKIEEHKFSLCTNGLIFEDNLGEFTRYRNVFLNGHPHNVKHKKIGEHLLVAGQTGQYNFLRSRIRKDNQLSYFCKAKYAESTANLIYLLNNKYRPFYKWLFRGLLDLDILGKQVSKLIDDLFIESDIEKELKIIEEIAILIINELKIQGYSNIDSNFLIDHCSCVLSKIDNIDLIKNGIQIKV